MARLQLREPVGPLSQINQTKVDPNPGKGNTAMPTSAGLKAIVQSGRENQGAECLMPKILSRLSLSQQFLLASFPILLLGTLVIGNWVGKQVEISVVHKIGGVSALYVDSFVAPHVQSLSRLPQLMPDDQAALRTDLETTPLGKKVLFLKIWRSDGFVLFSTDESVQGRKFPIDEGLAVALRGGIFSEVSVRTKEQQVQHGQPMPRLIETYTPIHEDRNGSILAVAEFYQNPDEVDREVRTAQQRSWLLVAGTTLAMYLLLFLVVRRGSWTITAQQEELGDKVRQLTELNVQNLKLQERVIRAAEKSTALNEIFLQRVSADIHDGPGQDLGYALMQLKNMDATGQSSTAETRPDWLANIVPVQLALESALSDLRAISSNLEVPDIEVMSLSAVASRVVRDFQGKTGAHVNLELPATDANASFRAKVTLFRVLQESLANTFRHARAKDCKVVLSANSDCLFIEISDGGPGFDAETAAKKGRYGLRGMRQRVEVVGGIFESTSTEGRGTRIKVSLPLVSHGIFDD